MIKPIVGVEFKPYHHYFLKQPVDPKKAYEMLAKGAEWSGSKSEEKVLKDRYEKEIVA